MRGKLTKVKQGIAEQRITPAGAGKTLSAVLTKCVNSDHPRRCGENDDGDISRLRDIGSPPQVRGKPQTALYRICQRRITPAGAGKTFALLNITHRAWDHPRRCGENQSGVTRLLENIGSPPQVRGKLTCFRQCGLPNRITPAGAGKTADGAFRSSRSWDHPRRCGENNNACANYATYQGSPPQVRGKHGILAVLNETSGITPAGAGKTPRYCGVYVGAWDHPRRCGENQYHSCFALGKAGITPAGAGKTRHIH